MSDTQDFQSLAIAQQATIAALTKERDEARERSAMDQVYREEAEAALAASQASAASAREALAQYGEHDSHCIRSRWSAGRPTKSGGYGYECEYAGKWYEVRPVDRTPKCECGLDAILAEQPDRAR